MLDGTPRLPPVAIALYVSISWNEARQTSISRPYWCDMIESVHVVFFLTCICTAERFSISCFFLFCGGTQKIPTRCKSIVARFRCCRACGDEQFTFHAWRLPCSLYFSIDSGSIAVMKNMQENAGNESAIDDWNILKWWGWTAIYFGYRCIYLCIYELLRTYTYI